MRRKNAGLFCQRVLPLQAGKTREVAVRGTQGQAVLNRERCKMRIGNSIRTAAQFQHVTQNCSMAFARGWGPHVRAIKPGFYLLPRQLDRFRPLKDSCVRDDSEIREETGPRDPDSWPLIQAGVQPPSGGGMLRHRGSTSVYQQIRVYKDHACAKISGSSRLRWLPKPRRYRQDWAGNNGPTKLE
jgi:hypothetical protein